MKHNIKITAILLGMFLITQLIGLAVINAYTNNELPYGMQPPEMKPEISLSSIIIAMATAIFLIFLLMRIKSIWLLRIWFFFVILIAMSITFNSVLMKLNYSSLVALIVAFPLAFYKIFRRNFLIHNVTELLIYPGIAAVFVPIFNLWTIVVLLLIISVYDIYAVWHSGFMQKMAKFQIEKIKVFAGFFIPYLSKKQKQDIKFLKDKYKNKIPEKMKNKKIKINLAILGGGDVVFPMIMAGVVLKTLGLISSLTIVLFAALALLILSAKSEKGKSYPAMPFLTAGCLIGLIVSFLI